MLHRERLHVPRHIYPVDAWRFTERAFYPPFLAQTETIFSVANGYLGMRGNFEEGEPVSEAGTFVNGFHEIWPIVYGEEAYGFAKHGQTILNVTDAKTIRLYVDDEPFYLPTADLLLFERTLDMRAGTLDRELIWEMPSGTQVSIRSRRLVSFVHRHLAAIEFEVMVLNAAAPVVISSEIAWPEEGQGGEWDPRKGRGLGHHPVRPRTHYWRDGRMVLSHSTRRSGMSLACGVEHRLETRCAHQTATECGENQGKAVFTVDARPGEPVRLTKFVAYHTSRRAPAEELCERAERTLDRAHVEGFAALVAGQRQFLDDFWRRSDVEFEGDPAVQQCLRWNLFQLVQASGRSEGGGIGARGLTGQTYEGHYFWDAEIYVLPFLIYTAPRIARHLLRFRYSMLDKARERAREVGQKGALFPWRTINGEEASAYYAAGTAQYHINADIMYAMKKYVEITGDEDFLFDEGAEMLVETARLWADLGFHNERLGRFCIHAVTGPDEYATVVNNNAYTNLMAQDNLRFAAVTVRRLQAEQPVRYAALVDRTGLEAREVGEWERAAAQMYVPYDEALGVHPQDDSFLERERWDFANTPPDKYPLLLHFHPLVLYRHQAVKQADVVLAMFLLSHLFTPEQKKRNWDYYDPITTGDSSLSVSIQSIVAFEIGYAEKARDYARYAALMDLADIGGNVKGGAHIASIGGTWMAVVYGFAGLRDHGGQLRFRPRLPGLARLRFPLTVRGQTLVVELGDGGATYVLREGTALTIVHEDEEITLEPGVPVSRALSGGG